MASARVAAAVFAGRRRTAPLGDETPEPLGNRCARPGRSHRYPDAVGRRERRGPWRAVLVLGLDGQNGSHLARAQAHAASAQPEEAVATGGWTQRQAPAPAGGLETDDREADDPVAHGL